MTVANAPAYRSKVYELFGGLDKCQIGFYEISPLQSKRDFCLNLKKVSSLLSPWGKYCKTFFDRNLRIFEISWSVCPWQAFIA
jgi:hypothetical protein